MISTETATNEEVLTIIKKLESLLDNEKPTHAIMACLSIALIIQYPDITPEQMVEGVHGMSQWTALYLDSIIEPVTAEERQKMN